MPSLPVHNHFEVLSVESPENESISVTAPRSDPLKLAEDVPALPISPSAPCPKIKSWERKLPRKYIVASTPSAHSLNLAIELQTTDTGQILGVSALLDSGATGLFIDAHLMQQHRLNTRSLLHPIPVYCYDFCYQNPGQPDVCWQGWVLYFSDSTRLTSDGRRFDAWRLHAPEPAPTHAVI
ncbi:hypothetical protein L208DRAFT_1560705 [Tricholoma matsutake]|nr:hypothetical protein L208DRAFT_1560705 [Tricholoma matsutake 945]